MVTSAALLFVGYPFLLCASDLVKLNPFQFVFNCFSFALISNICSIFTSNSFIIGSLVLSVMNAWDNVSAITISLAG